MAGGGSALFRADGRITLAATFATWTRSVAPAIRRRHGFQAEAGAIHTVAIRHDGGSGSTIAVPDKLIIPAGPERPARRRDQQHD